MLTASLVLYNTSKDQVYTVLNSVLESNCVSKLYVIDHSPHDWWRILEQEYSFIRYVHNENLGYGAGHNLAIKKAIEDGSQYHVVMNPDISFDSQVLVSLLNYMENHDDTTYILPKVRYPNGDLQYLCRRLPTPIDLFSRRFSVNNRFMKAIDAKYSLRHFSYDKIINPPCLSGCFMFLRIKTLIEYNIFFDDIFFMYFEDFDLIRRIHKVSKTIYYPHVEIIHNHAREAHINKKMFWVFIKSLIKYFNKWGWFCDKERQLWNQEIEKEIILVDNE